MYNNLTIKTLRKFVGKKQDQFAFEIGVNRSTYATWELKNQFPKEVLQLIESKYSKEIRELTESNSSGMLSDMKVNYYPSTEAMAKRIVELENLLQQKDTLIANQLSIIEMQNQTIQALKLTNKEV